MRKLQFISLGLFYLSLLGDWGTGFTDPFIIQLFNQTKGVAPELIDNEFIFNSILWSVTVIVALILLTVSVFKSKKSLNFNAIGIFITLFVMLFAIFVGALSYALENFPTGGESSIENLGYGPFLAIISLGILFFTFLRQLIKIKSR